MAKPLGPKSALIREAIKTHPNLKNKELAKVLNGDAARKLDRIEVTADDVAVQKQAVKGLRERPTEAASPDRNGHAEEHTAQPPVETPAAIETVTAATPDGTTSKAEAVRVALREGAEQPEDGVAFIKRRFGIDMERAAFSSYKSQQRAKDAANKPKGKPGRKPGPRKAEPAAAAVAPVAVLAVAVAPTGDLLDDIAAIKGMVAKLGADQVKRVVNLFA